MNFKSIATELFWLSASLIITILLSIFLFGWSFQKTNLDIQFNDASFLLSAFTFIAPLFLLITFIIFSIKGIRKLFSQSLPNIIIIISGLLLIFLITAISKEFLKMGVRIDSDSQSSSLGNRNVRKLKIQLRPSLPIWWQSFSLWLLLFYYTLRIDGEETEVWVINRSTQVVG